MTLHCPGIGIFGDCSANDFSKIASNISLDRQCKFQHSHKSIGLLWVVNHGLPPDSQTARSRLFETAMFRFSTTPTTGSILDHIFMPPYDPHDAASASKSAAALAASKESAVPLAMMFHSPRSPLFLLISQVGTPSSVNV